MQKDEIGCEGIKANSILILLILKFDFVVNSFSPARRFTTGPQHSKRPRASIRERLQPRKKVEFPPAACFF